VGTLLFLVVTTLTQPSIHSQPWVPGVARLEAASRDTRLDMGAFTISAYCLEGTMMNGEQVHDGAVAVDPSVIPMGSVLRVEGFGDKEFTAKDTGSAVIGKHIDMWMPEHKDAIEWGIRTRRVWLAGQDD
jgi:3D (Asp-Asp-Asp) domain-containing protein